jgi:hypothetical protein
MCLYLVVAVACLLFLLPRSFATRFLVTDIFLVSCYYSLFGGSFVALVVVVATCLAEYILLIYLVFSLLDLSFVGCDGGVACSKSVKSGFA